MSTNPPPDRTAELMLLGKIHGIVEGLRDGQELTNRRLGTIDERIDGVDGRLRTVEQQSAVNSRIAGGMSGGVVAVGVALIIEGMKQWLRRGSPH